MSNASIQELSVDEIEQRLPHQFRSIHQYDREQFVEGAAVYSNRDIRLAYEIGHIVIFPFVESSLQKESHEVTLGRHFFRINERVRGRFDWTNSEEVEDFYEYDHAKPHSEIVKEYKIEPIKHANDDDLVFMLGPEKRVLAHTNEFIGIKHPGTCKMSGLSSFGRIGISACYDANHGNSDFTDRWVLEIDNLDTEPVPLIVNYPIAQLTFMRSGMPDISEEEAEYIKNNPLAKKIKQWSPEAMLPKIYNKRPVNTPSDIENI